MKNIKFFVYGIVAIISVTILRCFQIGNLINPENGFFLDGYEGLGALLTSAIILIVAVGAVLGLFTKTKNVVTNPKPNGILGGAALLAGVAQLSEPFTLFATSYENSPVIHNLKLVFIGLSGLYFCYFGIMNLLGNRPKPHLSLILVVNTILRLISAFMSFAGMANISDNIYDILALTATLFFMLFYSKSLVGIEFKPGKTIVFASGITAVLLNAAAVLPRIIMTLLGVKQYAHIQVDNTVSVIFLTVYIAVYLIVISKNSTQENRE